MRYIAAICLVLLAGGLAPAAQRVQTIDARIIDGEVTAITDDSVVINIIGKQRTLARRDVAEIVFGEAADAMSRRRPGLTLRHTTVAV